MNAERFFDKSQKRKVGRVVAAGAAVALGSAALTGCVERIDATEGTPKANASNLGEVFQREDYTLEKSGKNKVIEWTKYAMVDTFFSINAYSLDSGFKEGMRELLDKGCEIENVKPLPDNEYVGVFTLKDNSCLKK